TRDRVGVLGGRAGDGTALLRRRPTGSPLLKRTAHKLVQGDLRPIIEAHRNDRRIPLPLRYSPPCPHVAMPQRRKRAADRLRAGWECRRASKFAPHVYVRSASG